MASSRVKFTLTVTTFVTKEKKITVQFERLNSRTKSHCEEQSIVKIYSYLNGYCEGHCLLRYETVSSGRKLPTSLRSSRRRKQSPPRGW